jgi:hypothetical protein
VSAVPAAPEGRRLIGAPMVWLRSALIGATTVAVVVITIVQAASPAQAKSSPSVVGQKYSDASGALSKSGYTVVVVDTVGDKVARPDCIVTWQQDRSVPPPENSGASATNETLVALNCYAPLASAKSPGNSLGSPAGQAAASSEAAAASASAASKSATPAG